MLCCQESGSKSHEEVGKESAEINFGTLFVPPPEFQSSPLDLQTDIKTVENGAKFSEPQKDLFQVLTANPVQGRFQASTLAQNKSASGHFHDVTLSSPDLFKPVPAQRRNLSENLQSESSDLFKDEGVNLFEAAKGDHSLHAERPREVNLLEKSPSIFVDPFKSSSNKEDDLFRSPQPTVGNPFRTATTNGDLFQAVPTESGEPFPKQDHPETKDLFGMSFQKNLDVFSSSSANTVDPFPSPITRDLFQDVSSLDDPFGTTPSKPLDPFQDLSNGTLDIFQPLPTKMNSNDVLEINTNNTASKATNSTSSLNSSSDRKLDMSSSPDLFSASESNPAIQPKSSTWQHDVILTTPQGTDYDILQPTPFTRARNLSMTPGRSPAQMTHVCNKCPLIFGKPWYFFKMLKHCTLRYIVIDIMYTSDFNFQTSAKATSSDQTTKERKASNPRKATETRKATPTSRACMKWTQFSITFLFLCLFIFFDYNCCVVNAPIVSFGLYLDWNWTNCAKNSS